MLEVYYLNFETYVPKITRGAAPVLTDKILSSQDSLCYLHLISPRV